MDNVAELEREALGIAAGAPVDPDPAAGTPPAADPVSAPIAGPTEEEVLAGYQMICGELVDSGCNALIPAWQVTPREVSKLSNAIARALMLWFPDMIIPPKYMALITIAGVGFEIAQARRDPETGRYFPARVMQNSGSSGTPARPDQTAPAH